MSVKPKPPIEEQRGRGNEIAFWICAAIVLTSCVASLYAPNNDLAQEAFWTGGAFTLVAVWLWSLDRAVENEP